jgi:hypothetical protein
MPREREWVHLSGPIRADDPATVIAMDGRLRRMFSNLFPSRPCSTIVPDSEQ